MKTIEICFLYIFPTYFIKLNIFKNIIIRIKLIFCSRYYDIAYYKVFESIQF